MTALKKAMHDIPEIEAMYKAANDKSKAAMLLAVSNAFLNTIAS